MFSNAFMGFGAFLIFGSKKGGAEFFSLFFFLTRREGGGQKVASLSRG